MPDMLKPIHPAEAIAHDRIAGRVVTLKSAIARLGAKIITV